MRDGGFQGGFALELTSVGSQGAMGGGWDAGQPHSILSNPIMGSSIWAGETLPASEGLPVVRREFVRFWGGFLRSWRTPKDAGWGVSGGLCPITDLRGAAWWWMGCRPAPQHPWLPVGLGDPASF